MARARTLLAERRAAEAMMAIEIVLAQQPLAREAQALRDEILAEIQATDPALATRELTAALDPEQALAQVELGHAYVEFDRPADAERCFKRALELEPASADAHGALAALYLSVAVHDGAEHHARRALAIDPGCALASQTLAAVLEKIGEDTQATAVLEAAYRRQALFRQPALEPRLTVLVLATTGAGNIPYRFIMPSRWYGRLVWYMEHARAEEQPSVGEYDLVLNAIGEADLAQESAAAVAAFLEACPRPVLNHPLSVARTRRDLLPERLACVPDVVVPQTVRLDPGPTGDNLIYLARGVGLDPPFLVRPIGSHGGAGLKLVSGPADARLDRASGSSCYLTRYIDYRSPDGLYRKHRVLFVDRQPYPYHLAISERWMVHHDSAGMRDSAERRDEELAFLADPAAALGERAMTAIGAIGRRLDLDYCGVDFALLPDGQVLVFEANATMLAHLEDPAGPFAAKNPYVQRIIDAFQGLLARKSATA